MTSIAVAYHASLGDTCSAMVHGVAMYWSNDRLARCAWVADGIELMLDGCRECWSYMLMHTMPLLGAGVVDRSTLWDSAGGPVIDTMIRCSVGGSVR